MHILLVAPPVLALKLGDYLERQGHLVDYAATGALSVHLAAARQFDAIVLAARVTDIGGMQVCRAMRKTLRLRTPLLVLLGENGEPALAALGHSADAYLATPFTVEQLNALLKALFCHRRKATSP